MDLHVNYIISVPEVRQPECLWENEKETCKDEKCMCFRGRQQRKKNVFDGI